MNKILSKLKIKTTGVTSPVSTTATAISTNISGTVTAAVPSYVNVGSTGLSTVTTTGYATAGYATTYPVGTAAAGSVLTSMGGVTTWANPVSSAPAHPVVISNQGKEIVRLEKDGTIVWAEGIKIDEAAEAFAKTISIAAEMRAGITERIKADMRNRIFEEIINISKEKGSLSTDELTLMLEATKIMEKLKGL